MLTAWVRHPGGNRARIGLSLPEVLVAITVAGVLLAVVSTIALRQQRFFSAIFDILAVSGELRETATILPVDLRAVSTSAGDIRGGEARDTSLEARVTIATAVVCDTSGGRIMLAPVVDAGPIFSAASLTPTANDTAWLLTLADTSEIWQPHRIAEVSSGRAGSCGVGGPVLTGAALTTTRLSLRSDSVATVAAPPGTPLRITRPLRYSLYRAADGAWYLGQRDWNTTTLRFNSVQPVSGPFLAPASGGLRFRYFDSAGVEVPSATMATPSIALVRVVIAAETRHVVRIAGVALNASGKHADSVTVAVRLHNSR